jgi:hypothetical protein
MVMDRADYPFARPARSQLILSDRAVPVVSAPPREPLAKWVVDDGDGPITVDALLGPGYAGQLGLPRQAVVAYGSNANPDVLREKLAGVRPTLVPMLHAELRDFDVVYSAHVSPRGAIPATLAECPGTRTTVFVLLLGAEQLAALDETEPNYDRVPLPRSAELNPEFGAVADAHAYLSKHGPLSVDGAPRHVDPIPAGDGSFDGMTQREALELVRDRLGTLRGGEAT